MSAANKNDDEIDKYEKKEQQEKASFNPIVSIVDPLREFVVESTRLVNKCTKPDAQEYKKIAWATSIGFLIMGFVGFFVKIIHIPIHNILIGGGTN